MAKIILKDAEEIEVIENLVEVRAKLAEAAFTKASFLSLKEAPTGEDILVNIDQIFKVKP